MSLGIREAASALAWSSCFYELKSDLEVLFENKCCGLIISGDNKSMARLTSPGLQAGNSEGLSLWQSSVYLYIPEAFQLFHVYQSAKCPYMC